MGRQLHGALSAFHHAYEAGDSLEKPFEDVYTAVRQVQSRRRRWKRLSNKYGSVSHYFDGFGQIKPQYRRSARKQQKQPPKRSNPQGVLMFAPVVAALFLGGCCKLPTHSFPSSITSRRTFQQ